MFSSQPDPRDFDKYGFHPRRDHLREEFCLISLPQVGQGGQRQSLAADRVIQYKQTIVR